MVEVTEGEPGNVMEHGCEARICEYGDCSVIELMEEMVQVGGDEWYCPDHGLLVAAKELVSFYRADGDADWTAISEIIGETLPDLVTKVEAQEASKRS